MNQGEYEGSVFAAWHRETTKDNKQVSNIRMKCEYVDMAGETRSATIDFTFWNDMSAAVRHVQKGDRLHVKGPALNVVKLSGKYKTWGIAVNVHEVVSIEAANAPMSDDPEADRES